MLTETDLNLLEAYLDDALSASEVQALDVRLSEDPQAAAALDSLRRQRQARVTAFASLTPEAASADRFADTVLSTIRRRQFKRRLMCSAQWITSLAACLIVGLVVGWIGRGSGPPKALPQVVTPATTPQKTYKLVIDVVKAAGPGQYRVVVVDGKDNVVDLEHFDALDDAQRFVAYIGQYPPHHQTQDNSLVKGNPPVSNTSFDQRSAPPHRPVTSAPSTQPSTQPSK